MLPLLLSNICIDSVTKYVWYEVCIATVARFYKLQSSTLVRHYISETKHQNDFNLQLFLLGCCCSIGTTCQLFSFTS